MTRGARYGEAVIVVPVSISAFSEVRQVPAITNGSARNEIPYVVSGKLASGMVGGVRFSHSGTLKLPRYGAAGTAASKTRIPSRRPGTKAFHPPEN